MADGCEPSLFRDPDSLRFLYGVCSRDPTQRLHALENVSHTIEGWLEGYGSPKESILENHMGENNLGADYKHLIREQMPDLVRLSLLCPFVDVREHCQKLLEDLKVSTIFINKF